LGDEMKKICQFASIQKVESNDDGTITVIGIASDMSTDADGEVITADAMKAAIPDYMALGTGALREMHQLSAAGKVNKAEVNDLGQTIIEATVVDPVAILKVQQGVYKGFSVGGSSTAKLGKMITGLRLTEISLVDKPNNPNAIIHMWKCEDFNKPGEDPDQPPENNMSQNENRPVVKAETVGDVAKGMYAVSDFACFLREIAWMVDDAKWESESEGDNSPVPGQLKTWLELGVEIFQDMAKEETSELIASLQKAHAANDIAKADMAVVVTAEVKPVEAIVAAVVEKAEVAADKQVVQPVIEEQIQKVEPAQDITKALAPVMDVIKALQAQNEQLIKAQTDLSTRLNSLPAQPKGVLIEKAADASSIALSPDTSTTVEPVRKADGSVDTEATLMKNFYANARPVSLAAHQVNR
jgi:hypothetical protein